MADEGMQLDEKIINVSEETMETRPISINSIDTFTTTSTINLEIDTSNDNISEDRQSNYSAFASSYPQNYSFHSAFPTCANPMEFGILSDRHYNIDHSFNGVGGEAHSRVLTQINDINILSSMNNSTGITLSTTDNQNKSFSYGGHVTLDHFINPYNMIKPRTFLARLEITEQPMEKFRFRYKSEMNGTHGALHGISSQRLPKTYPEVRLVNFEGSAIIRCTLFQVNIDSPHSHQLIVRRDETDYVDPHELFVSQEEGYYAKFMNMGIIHTAKRYVIDELLKKKRHRLITELKRELTFKEDQEIYIQCEREAKDMNLNQVRLCFEAFIFAEGKIRIPIAAPIFSKVISNRKSALTGELRITRSSIFSGSVMGGDDLILLVEKVNKKNIKVRFYEIFEDDLVWEGFAKFRENDVHHQYAIVCKTPPYRDFNIQSSVEVNVELVRPSDDEHSASITFRYKPREIVTCRKRRHTNSSTMIVHNSDSSGCSSSGRSFLGLDEIPRSIVEENNGVVLNSDDIFEELEQLLNNKDLKKKITSFTDSVTIPDLLDYLQTSEYEIKQMVNMQVGRTEKDGIASGSNQSGALSTENRYYCKLEKWQNMSLLYLALRRIICIYTVYTRLKFLNENAEMCKYAAIEISNICVNFSDQNELGDSLLHEIIINNDDKLAIKFCEMLEYLKTENIINTLFINYSGQNVLHYACLYNRPQFIRPLVRMGCDVNLADRKGNTPLHLAVLEKNIECLNSFLNIDANIILSKLNDDGFTVLHLAIRSNYTDFVKKLITKDRDLIGVINTMDGGNALHMAIQQEQLEMVKLLLSEIVPENVLKTKNSAGLTPYQLAQKHSQNFESISSEILNTLIIYLQNMDVECKTDIDLDKLIINGNELSNPNQKLIYSVKTENDEEEDTDDENINLNNNSNDPDYAFIDKFILKKALMNPTIFVKLRQILDKDELWEKLAQLIGVDYFFIIRAQGLLNWMKRNVEIINYEKFNEALIELSIDAHTLIISHYLK